MIYLTLEDVIKIHDGIISEFGGSYGLRDSGLLISAIETPKATMFGNDLYPSMYDKAAAYLFHIVCNHPFIDGNKRTGALSTLVFLNVNEVKYYMEDDEYEELVLNVSTSKANKKDISEFFSKGFEK